MFLVQTSVNAQQNNSSQRLYVYFSLKFTDLSKVSQSSSGMIYVNWFTCSKRPLKSFVFLFFWLWGYLMMGYTDYTTNAPAHLIRYLFLSRWFFLCGMVFFGKFDEISSDFWFRLVFLENIISFEWTLVWSFEPPPSKKKKRFS